MFGLTLSSLFAFKLQAQTEFFVPSDPNPGEEYRIAFVTDGVRDGTSTNI